MANAGAAEGHHHLSGTRDRASVQHGDWHKRHVAERPNPLRLRCGNRGSSMSSNCEATEHPVQTGASIADHAYIVPARLVLDIGMSDAMDAYFSPTTWSGSDSKSVAAYQTMLALQFSRIPLTITTKLRTYQNMVIDSARAARNSERLSRVCVCASSSVRFFLRICRSRR